MTFCTCDFITDWSIANYQEIPGRVQSKTSWLPLHYTIAGEMSR